MINAQYFLEIRVLIIPFQCICLSSLSFLSIGSQYFILLTIHNTPESCCPSDRSSYFIRSEGRVQQNRVAFLREILSLVVNQTIEKFCNSLNRKNNGYSIVMLNSIHLNSFLLYLSKTQGKT